MIKPLIAFGVLTFLCVPLASAGPTVALADKPKAPPAPAVAPADQDPVHEVRRVMAETADRAVGPDAVTKVLDMINPTDRARLEKEIAKGDDKKYQAEADKFHQAWKDKYGQPFAAESHIDALGDVNVSITGEGAAQKAIINFPAEPGEKRFALHLMRSKDNWWRIELPDSLDGKNFFDKLMQSVTRVVDRKDKLPGSMNKGYQRVTTELLHEMAFPAGTK